MRASVLLILVSLLAAPAQAQTVYYAHTDILGNVVAVTDKYRNVVERRVYEPYGLPNTPIIDGPGFTGHDMDGDTGLVYMQQRYYDPLVGAFLSVDPVGVNVANGGNFNRYWYANDNPYKYVDPDGRDSFLVSRRLQGISGVAGNHNFIVHHASEPGDPNGIVRSFGDVGNDTMGEVTQQTQGFSEGTFEADRNAWNSLAADDNANVTFRRIDAADDVVAANADALVGGDEYSAIPALQGGVNSNSGSGAIAQRSDGGPPRVDNGRSQPGSEESAVERVQFEDRDELR